MKRIISTLLVLSLLVLPGCSGGEAPTDKPESVPQQTQEPENNDRSQPEPKEETPGPNSGIQVDESLLTVDITLPADLAGTEEATDFDPEAFAAENGYIKAVVNDDKTVTVTMTQAKHKEIMSQMKDEVIKNLNAMVGSEDYPATKEVQYDDNFQKIVFLVDGSLYSGDFSHVVTGIYVAVYKAFEGAEFNTLVQTIDAATGEVLAETQYPLE